MYIAILYIYISLHPLLPGWWGGGLNNSPLVIPGLCFPFSGDICALSQRWREPVTIHWGFVGYLLNIMPRGLPNRWTYLLNVAMFYIICLDSCIYGRVDYMFACWWMLFVGYAMLFTNHVGFLITGRFCNLLLHEEMKWQHKSQEVIKTLLCQVLYIYSKEEDKLALLLVLVFCHLYVEDWKYEEKH